MNAPQRVRLCYVPFDQTNASLNIRHFEFTCAFSRHNFKHELFNHFVKKMKKKSLLMVNESAHPQIKCQQIRKINKINLWILFVLQEFP